MAPKALVRSMSSSSTRHRSGSGSASGPARRSASATHSPNSHPAMPVFSDVG